MKTKLNHWLLACTLFTGMQLSAQTTDISTGLNSSGLINFFSNDDDWKVQLPAGGPFIGVECGGGTVETGTPCVSAVLYSPPGVRWLSPYMTNCTSGTAFTTGAHIPWVTEQNPTNYYNYRMPFKVTRCNPDSVVIRLSYAQCDNYFDSFRINGIPYPAPTTSLPWTIVVNPGDVNVGVNYLTVEVVNTGYNTGMGLKGNIAVTGGINADPAFALSVTGGNLVGTPANTGSNTWEVYGSSTGIPGSYAYVGTYYTDPLSIPATMKCYYVKHTLQVAESCNTLCDAQSICKDTSCVGGPNPCDLSAPRELSYDPAHHKFTWAAVTGAVSYILQIIPDDPACCDQDPYGTIKRAINIPLFGTQHILDGYHDLGMDDEHGELCFSWRVIPVCESGSWGTPSDKLCSNGSPANRASHTSGLSPLKETISRNTLNVFPNPAKGQVSFDIETVSDMEFSVTVTDITGRTVKVFNELKTSDRKAIITWNTESMNKGTYLVKIQTADRQVITRKLSIE